MSILPCKNCGHTWFAHSAGWPRGCSDCPPKERCGNFEDAYVLAKPPHYRHLGPLPGKQAGSRMKAGDKVIVRRLGVATYYTVNEIASFTAAGSVVLAGTEQRSATHSPFDVVPFTPDVWAKLQAFGEEYADLRRRQLEAWAEIKAGR